MGKKPPPDPDDKYKDMEDWEIVMILKRTVPSCKEHELAQKEMFKRMIDKKWLKK